MHTAKACSTISYNTESYLKTVLDRLVDKHIIEFYMFIKHVGEVDELTGVIEKDHIHLFIIPNKRIDTMELQQLLKEPDPNNEIPLGCIDFCPSKSDDFILYCLHDKFYLASKFETRQFEYEYKDFIVSNRDSFDRKYKGAFHSSGYARTRNLYNYVVSGGSLNGLLKIGAIPPNQVSNYEDYFKIVKKNYNTEIVNKEIKETVEKLNRNKNL